jgi:hypothetical protein
MNAYDDDLDETHFERMRNRAPRFTYARKTGGSGNGWQGMHRRHRTRWSAPTSTRGTRSEQR